MAIVPAVTTMPQAPAPSQHLASLRHLSSGALLLLKHRGQSQKVSQALLQTAAYMDETDCAQQADKMSMWSRRVNIMGALLAFTAIGFKEEDKATAVSTSRRALRGEKVPESEYKSLPNGLKYYDLKVGGGTVATKGSRVAVHYVAKWKGLTFMTSRQGLGATGGTPYGFDVGSSEAGYVLKGLDLGVLGMRVGGQRLLIIPPELAYGSKGVQEIPPNATLEFNVELLSIKQSPFGSPVKLVEG